LSALITASLTPSVIGDRPSHPIYGLLPTIPLRLNPHFLLEVDVDPRKSMDEQKVRE
jgi:hypothetical protein